MNKIYNYAKRNMFSFALLLSILLASCAPDQLATQYSGQTSVLVQEGQITCLQMRGTLYGIERALASKPHTFIMNSGSNYAFFWSMAERGWAFIVVDTKKLMVMRNFIEVTGGKANLVSPKSINDLRSFMQGLGWKVVPASVVPEIVSTSISTAGSWLWLMASSMPTFVFMTMPETNEYNSGGLTIEELRYIIFPDSVPMEL